MAAQIELQKQFLMNCMLMRYESYVLLVTSIFLVKKITNFDLHKEYFVIRNWTPDGT